MSRLIPVSRQGGFTMLELMAVMVVLAILSSGAFAILSKQRLQDLEYEWNSLAGEQMRFWAEAAQSFALDNSGAWPDEASGCVGAMAVLSAAGYVPGLPQSAPARGTYTTTCTTGATANFSVSVDAGSTRSAELIANVLPTPVLTGTTVTASWPLPSAIPALDSLLDLAGTREMQGNLDMGGHALVNADDVVTQTGQSLATAVTFATEVAPGESVTKPDCPSGTSAGVWVGFRRASLPSASPLYGFDVDPVDLGTQWRFNPVMIGPSGVEAVNSTYVRMLVITKCS